MNSIPEFLYKYRPLTPHTLRTISHSEIFFPFPKDFNDPFDCNIVPDPQYTRKEAEEYIRQLKTVDPDNHFEKAYNTFRTEGMQKFYDSMLLDIQGIRDTVRICSLSEIPNSVMMFSHYAQGHRGLCFEFKSGKHGFFDSLAPVLYPDAFPIFHPFRDAIDRYQQLLDAELLTKSKEWSYEKEWRIIKAAPEPTTYEFPEACLNAIIFGCLTSEKDRELVQEINQARESPAQLREAYRIEKSFALGIRAIDS